MPGLAATMDLQLESPVCLAPEALSPVCKVVHATLWAGPVTLPGLRCPHVPSQSFCSRDVTRPADRQQTINERTHQGQASSEQLSVRGTHALRSMHRRAAAQMQGATIGMLWQQMTGGKLLCREQKPQYQAH